MLQYLLSFVYLPLLWVDIANTEVGTFKIVWTLIEDVPVLGSDLNLIPIHANYLIDKSPPLSGLLTKLLLLESIHDRLTE